MTQLICADETTSGSRAAALVLDMAEERVTVREVIRRRIFQEVAEFHAREAAGPFRGLVRPTETEETLNGPRRTIRRCGSTRSGSSTPRWRRSPETGS